MSSPPPGWRCPYCKDKKCRAYDRTEQTLGDLPGHFMFEDDACRRHYIKSQIRELQACKKRMAK